jgi:GH18 family chitinase
MDFKVRIDQFDGPLDLMLHLIKEGEMVCTYEDAESLGWKCRFIKEKGLRGAMYWEYRCDDEAGTLRNAVWNGIMGQ